MGTALDDFFTSRDWPAVEARTGWKVMRDPADAERVFQTLPARDGEIYRALLLCDGYPTVAPGVAFVNAEGSRSDVRAWPAGTSAFYQEVKLPPAAFLCVPLTREGLQQHPDWRTNAPDAWNATAHNLMTIFNHLQRLLTSPDYTGRAGP